MITTWRVHSALYKALITTYNAYSYIIRTASSPQLTASTSISYTPHSSGFGHVARTSSEEFCVVKLPSTCVRSRVSGGGTIREHGTTRRFNEGAARTKPAFPPILLIRDFSMN